MDTLDDLRWLTGPVATELLCRLRDEDVRQPSMAARLRKDHSARRVHLLLEQVELRHRAKKKFTQAEQMFFTRAGLEQATDERVARYKAERFHDAVADLCCGVGGDLVSLADRGPVVGIDKDAAAAHLAAANCAAAGHDTDHAVVRCADVAEVPLDEIDAWHLDPDRRPSGKRSVQLDHHEPPPTNRQTTARAVSACRGQVGTGVRSARGLE